MGHHMGQSFSPDLCSLISNTLENSSTRVQDAASILTSLLASRSLDVSLLPGLYSLRRYQDSKLFSRALLIISAIAGEKLSSDMYDQAELRYVAEAIARRPTFKRVKFLMSSDFVSYYKSNYVNFYDKFPSSDETYRMTASGVDISRSIIDAISNSNQRYRPQLLSEWLESRSNISTQQCGFARLMTYDQDYRHRYTSMISTYRSSSNKIFDEYKWISTAGKCGVQNWFRFSPEIYSQLQSTPHGYNGVAYIIISNSDGNSAFQNLTSIARQVIKLKCQLKIYEVDSDSSVSSLLCRIDQHDVAIIVGHGGGNGLRVVLSENEGEEFSFEAEEVPQRFNGTLIFVTCNAGAPGMIVTRLRKKGINAYGSPEEISVSEVELYRDPYDNKVKCRYIN